MPRPSQTGGLGQLYQRFWGCWLQGLCQDLGLRNAHDPVPALEEFVLLHNPVQLLKQARKKALQDLFEPVSFAILNAHSQSTFVERWLAIARLQGRLGQQGHVAWDSQGFFCLRPGESPLASKSVAGPVILAGASWGLLERWGMRVADIVLDSQGRAQNLYRDGVFFDCDNLLDGNSNYIFNVIEDHHQEKQAACFDVSFLTNEVPSLDVRLNHAWTRIMEDGRGPGQHISQDEIARQLRIAPRTLSRRLTKAGTSWREMSQILRYRKACFYMNEGMDCQDEISFQAGYADRHHMARDFRRLGGTSPGTFMDIMRI